jgi:uroporphyrinogen decarboxylase
MNSKERFQAALNHNKPDRVPVDYLATAEVTENLKKYFGISTERELLDTLNADFYYLSFRDISQNESGLPFYKGPKLYFAGNERVCPLGVRFHRKVFRDKFGADEAISGPFENISSTREILDHPWPKPDWFDLEPLIKESEDFSDKVIIGGFWSALFSHCFRMYGYQNFLMDMLMKPDNIRTLIDRTTEFYLEMNERMFSTMKGKMDIFFLGSDFGSQQGLLFSEETWMDLYYNNYKKLIDHAHSHGLKVMFHSCGSVSPLIPHFIKLGVDILDPVQITAANMEPQWLKDRFGKDIGFHGAIDTQHALPNLSAEEIIEYTLNTIRILGKNGGYILAPCNNIQNDTPMENIEALYQALKMSQS